MKNKSSPDHRRLAFVPYFVVIAILDMVFYTQGYQHRDLYCSTLWSYDIPILNLIVH